MTRMVDRALSRAAHHGARLLFLSSIIMLLAGAARFFSVLTGDVSYFATMEHLFRSFLAPAAGLLVCALLIHRLGCR